MAVGPCSTVRARGGGAGKKGYRCYGAGLLREDVGFTGFAATRNGVGGDIRRLVELRLALDDEVVVYI